jgi:hypothetical protein
MECRDVVGSIRYAKSRRDLVAMTTGLYSRCMGGNSTVIAMCKWPGEFTHIKALVLLMVVSGRTSIERGAENLHLDPQKAAERLDERLRELTGMRLNEETLCLTQKMFSDRDLRSPGVALETGAISWILHLRG